MSPDAATAFQAEFEGAAKGGLRGNGATTRGLDDLIKAALKNKRYNHERCAREVERCSRRISIALAPNLPDDLHGDIAQEALTILFQAGPEVLTKDTSKAAFHKAVLKAIGTFRATFAPPGQRTGCTPRTNSALLAAEDACLVDADIPESSDVGEGLNRSDTQAVAPIKQVEDRMEIDFILCHAPGLVASLGSVHLDDEPVEAAAAAAHLSRFALNRQVKASLSGRRQAA